MADLPTGLAVAGGLIASKDIILKLLGPTADYIGECGRDVVRKGHENLGRILGVAYSKIRSDIEKPGQVNPRVFKNVFDDGRFVDDVFSAEYFGGITASARTVDGRDDSGLPWISLVKSLSSDQIRLHFTLYSLMARLPHKQTRSTRAFAIGDLQVEIPSLELLIALELASTDGPTVFALAAQGLIDCDLLSSDSSWRIGDMRKNWRLSDETEDCVMLRGTNRGGMLFLRALGLRGVHPEIIPTLNLDYSLTDAVKAAQNIPDRAVCRHRPLQDPLARLGGELEDRINSLESDIDDVKSSIEEAESCIEATQDAVQELEDSLTERSE